MQITFKGVPGEEHEAITQYGITFPVGQAVEVDEKKNAFAVRKLRGHPHFECDGVEEAAVVGETRVDAGAVHAAQATQALAAFAIDSGATGLLTEEAQAGRQVVDEPMAEDVRRNADTINAPRMPEPGSDGEEDWLDAYAETHGLKFDGRWGIERKRSAVLNEMSGSARSEL